jgi:hypothetical protein
VFPITEKVGTARFLNFTMEKRPSGKSSTVTSRSNGQAFLSSVFYIPHVPALWMSFIF